MTTNTPESFEQMAERIWLSQPCPNCIEFMASIRWYARAITTELSTQHRAELSKKERELTDACYERDGLRNAASEYAREKEMWRNQNAISRENYKKLEIKHQAEKTRLIRYAEVAQAKANEFESEIADLTKYKSLWMEHEELWQVRAPPGKLYLHPSTEQQCVSFEEWWDGQEWLSGWADSRGVGRAAYAAGAQSKEPHTDHPARHYDRTCPGCDSEQQEIETLRSRLESVETQLLYHDKP